MGETERVAALGGEVLHAKALNRRAKGSGTIIAEGEQWRARLPGGARASVALEPSYEAAEKKLQAALEALGAAPSPDARIPFWEWVERCLVMREQDGLRDTDNERWRLGLHIGRDEIGRMPLALLQDDPKAVRAWLVRMRLKGGGGRGRKKKSAALSPRTITNMIALARDAFKRAVDREVCERNPFIGLSLPRTVRRAATTEEEFAGVLEPHEQTAVLRAAEGEGSQFRAMLRVALGTAIRKAELLQLRWESGVRLDGLEPHLVIRFGKKRKAGAPSPTGPNDLGAPTKGGRTRKVPLFGMALDAIIAWRDECLEETLCAVRRRKRLRDQRDDGGASVAEKEGLRDRDSWIGHDDDPFKAVHSAHPAVAEGERIGTSERDDTGRSPAGVRQVNGTFLIGGARERQGVTLTGLVFPGPRGERVKAPLAAFARVLDKAGVGRHVTWHDLRHTGATSLLEGWWGPAWTVEEVRQVCGHKHASTTERYLHARGSLSFRKARENRAFFRDGMKTGAQPLVSLTGDVRVSSPAGDSEPEGGTKGGTTV